MTKYRTHSCGELTEKNIGERSRLSGWVHRKRDHGSLLFVDLRDHYGLTQCVIESDREIFPSIENVHAESVITIEGSVVARSEETKNKEKRTTDQLLTTRQSDD